jgi:hypothetical protein
LHASTSPCTTYRFRYQGQKLDADVIRRNGCAAVMTAALAAPDGERHGLFTVVDVFQWAFKALTGTLVLDTGS